MACERPLSDIATEAVASPDVASTMGSCRLKSRDLNGLCGLDLRLAHHPASGSSAIRSWEPALGELWMIIQRQACWCGVSQTGHWTRSLIEELEGVAAAEYRTPSMFTSSRWRHDFGSWIPCGGRLGSGYERCERASSCRRNSWRSAPICTGRTSAGSNAGSTT